MRVQGSHDNEYPHYHQPTDSLPGLYAITGGDPAGIVSGFDMEAKAGGLPAFYVAKTGSLGSYGDVLFFGDQPDGLPDDGDAATAQDTPLPSAALLLAGLALALLAQRRRRGNA
jgi:MYXO-CTERM domain-containing protein